jgi:hypothetical protein
MAHVGQAPNAACEDVADGADAPRVGSVFIPEMNLAAPPEGDTARSVVAGRGRRGCTR